jgi:hypothetical protein
MISIPCTVPIESFKNQISFFQFQHNSVYGEKASEKAIIPILKYNHFEDTPIEDVNWKMTLPYRMVNSVYDYIEGSKQWYIPINVFTAAKQIIEHLRDEEVVEIIDADLVHLKHYPLEYDLMPYDVVIADNIYENWHMNISKKDGKNRNVIDSHLWHDMNAYMNGGFNVIGRVKTIKKIIDDVIKYSCLITEEAKGSEHSWWCAMYGLNVSCHNHRIKMIDGNNCYYPNVNKLNENHYIAHYSVDPLFNKHNMEKIDTKKFPDNLFYNQAKKWLSSIQ